MLIALSSMFTAAAPGSAAAPQVRTQVPGFYRMMLGDFAITALLDGTHPFPDAEVLTKAGPGVDSERSRLFDNNPAEANALLAASDLKVPTEGSIDAFLVNTGKKLVWIDSGAGTLYGACCGHLIENLRAAGYLPEQIDEVFLTHLHADHCRRDSPRWEDGLSECRYPGQQARHRLLAERCKRKRGARVSAADIRRRSGLVETLQSAPTWRH
jgi:Metallo-beta-lactamase superfamily